MYGINDQGQVVGDYRPSDSNQNLGFVYNTLSQTFSTFAYSSDTSTYAYAINNAGTIAGFIQGIGSNPGVGFELNGSAFTLIKVSHALQTAVTAINNTGQSMVLASSPTVVKNFLFTQGDLAKVSEPDNFQSIGINDSGTITGAYTMPNGNANGFVYENGFRQSLTFPGAISTVATAINKSGQVVGFFYDAGNNVHAFLWTSSAGAPKP